MDIITSAAAVQYHHTALPYRDRKLIAKASEGRANRAPRIQITNVQPIDQNANTPAEAMNVQIIGAPSRFRQQGSLQTLATRYNADGVLDLLLAVAHYVAEQADDAGKVRLEVMLEIPDPDTTYPVPERSPTASLSQKQIDALTDAMKAEAHRWPVAMTVCIGDWNSIVHQTAPEPVNVVLGRSMAMVAGHEAGIAGCNQTHCPSRATCLHSDCRLKRRGNPPLGDDDKRCAYFTPNARHQIQEAE
ncbi:MAG: hypothetical protein AWU57_468 [Marinobacter sp. T13-3]|nr:MAG: hypothetical protein AWU57_468 [Marinobacter sp. T13-3]